MAHIIKLRLAVLEGSPSLAQVPTGPPIRCHLLKGKLREHFAVDLVHPHRLVFRPAHDPLPRKADRAIDIAQVKAIQITAVIDYH